MKPYKDPDEFIKHLSEKKSIDKILDSTANVIESIGRNSGTEYDNLTAAILEMNGNSTLKKKMKKSTKILLVILSLLLIGGVVFNILMQHGDYSFWERICNMINR